VLIQVLYYNNNAITCDFEGTIIGFNTPIWQQKNLQNGFPILKD
jgi:hypothetical protein